MPRSALFANKQSGGMFSIEDLSRSTGQRFFVHSGTGADTAGNGRSPDAPLATIDYAIGLCTANKNDIIYVMPGHAENISAAGYITADIAGISIIGLGNGSNRPTLTFSNTAGTILVTADNVTIQNVRCTVSVDSVVTGISITGANCTLDAVDFFETASVQMLIFILTSATADGLTIKNCVHIQAAAGSAKWIDLVGCDNCVIVDNFFHVNAITHILGGTTTASLQVNIHRNKFVNPSNAAVIVLLAASTGLVTFNHAGGAKTSQAAMFALASAYGCENFVTNAANTNGLLDPAVDT